ncbi:SRPBCC family protein [Brachybacterium saurashtrense]|uniref:Toxin-antitoxin system toxin subunit n=1 Tax=Brachybacterium saurashtrense TaxID=556288 RepID=A0A345YRT8_9MICO|nr:SRPBCC family protein [Brachybacterium saurashtrense]AXK46640.1 toxin-antitoxin system toxin subunit [Brachybacterium saurashtrense]RRR22354.1 toxin-antitoxin system toxin subunit [Brachybacterium saurashtrense]
MTSTDPQLHDVDGGTDIVVRRRYPHPIERVWRAVTETEHLAAWFPGAPEFDLRVGGTVRFAEFAGDPAEFGEVLALEPPRLLRFTWDTDVVTLEFAPAGEGTELVLTNRLADRPAAASVATGWEACLGLLTAVVAGEPPEDPGPRFARHEELAARFGLSRPVLEETTDGWSARFERQLVCSPEAAWELFLGGAAEPEVTHEVPAAGQELRAPRAPEVVLGIVTEVEAGRLLAVDTGAGEPGDHVRFELVEGTGHGARMVLTVRGTDPAERDAALAQWGGGAVEAIAAAALAHVS